MILGAPRRSSPVWRQVTRGAVQLLWMVAVLCGATAASGQTITDAHYIEPTDRYDHGVLGDAIEWGGLEVTLSTGKAIRFQLPATLVFEDTEPRLRDLDKDGQPEIISVLTHVDMGASLAVFGPAGLITQTPHIGRRNRWLAPVGAGDFYNDGGQVIAYVDRPHLAKTLRLWRYDAGVLQEVESLPGLTNHRIGDDYITGGVRNCGAGDEIITVDANWQSIVVTAVKDGGLLSRIIAPYDGRASVAQVLSCK